MQVKQESPRLIQVADRTNNPTRITIVIDPTGNHAPYVEKTTIVHPTAITTEITQGVDYINMPTQKKPLEYTESNLRARGDIPQDTVDLTPLERQELLHGEKKKI